MSTSVLVMGAGNIGAVIARNLAATGDYAVALADRDPKLLVEAQKRGMETLRLDAGDAGALDAACRGKRIVVSAALHTVNPLIAAAASRSGADYFDLTEDTASTTAIRKLAQDGKTAFLPQCGLAPGFVSVAAQSLAQRFERLRSIRIRVGALPRFPNNALRYQLSWSTDGLINEYCNPCEAVQDGKHVQAPPLDGLERLSFDGLDYEAFNTSGGLGTLAETLEGKVDELNYKTIRYPGHCDVMKLLLDDLRLRLRRDLLKEILETALPTVGEDVVVIFIAVTGERGGRLVQETYFNKIYGHAGYSAIQATTASGLCAMVDLFLAGKLPRSGFVRQEQASLDDFLANRFGKIYAPS